ncbi:MAG: hypothetical protein ACPGSI_18960 [Pikeienuella sp.]
MTDEQAKKLDDLHEFLFGTIPGVPSSKSRAEQVEDLLKAYRAGSFMARLSLWAAGLITAVGTAYLMLKGSGQ